MPRPMLLAALAASLALTTSAAVAGTENAIVKGTAPALPDAPVLTAAPALTTAPRVKPTPMVAELLQLLEVERTQVAELRRTLAGTRDHAVALTIQRQIEQIKLGTEVGLLRVQITYARREGRQEAVERLERAMNLIQSPPARGRSIEPASSSPR